MDDFQNPFAIPIILKNPQTQVTYKILDVEGRACGTLTVYRATETKDDSEEINKIDDTTCTTTTDHYVLIACATETPDVHRLQQEITRNEIFGSHPNILGVNEVFVFCGRLCVILPRLNLGSLRSLTMTSSPYGLDEGLIVSAVAKVTKAIGFLHDANLVHTSITPGHVYVNSSAEVNKIDPNIEIKIGFAATLFDKKEDCCPTPLAAPPEALSDEEYTQKGDIWLIGITALELAFGWKGLAEVAEKHNNLMSMIRAMQKDNKLPPRLNWDSDFSDGFQKLVLDCLKMNPSERPGAEQLQNYQVFGNHLLI